MEPYSIPTKQGDDKNERPSAMNHLVGDSQHQHAQDDAFSRYSNDFLRMKSLLLLSEDLEDGDDDNDDLDALATINQARRSVGLSNLVHLNRDKRRRGNDSRRIQQGNERKTRLSWELHPDLILHDFILELEQLDSGIHRIVDDEGDASEEQQSQVQEEEEKQEQEAPREVGKQGVA